MVICILLIDVIHSVIKYINYIVYNNILYDNFIYESLTIVSIIYNN